MKRTKALAEIKWCGFHEETGRAVLIATQNDIGKAASTKAYRDGQKMKDRGESCGCDRCARERKQ